MAKRFSTKQLSKSYSKWTSPAYYSTGYKSSSKSYGNSSFWMDDDFLDEDKSKDTSKVDYVKLAGYKRAISNFVRIVTGKDDIPVIYSSGNDSYTDGKKVVISSKLDENEFDSTVGLALHEGSHIALTDFKGMTNILSAHGPRMIELQEWHKEMFNEDESQYTISLKVKDLVNIIEDRRIDRFVYDSAPGYQGYYKSLYDKYFNAKEIDQALLDGTKTEESWDDYIFHICNFANPNRQLDSLLALRAIWNMISIPTINRLKTTTQVAELAIEVYKTIMNQIGGSGVGKGNQPEDQEEGQGGAGQGEQDIATDGESSDDQNGIDPNLDIQGQASGPSDAPAKDSKQLAQEAKDRKSKQALDKAIQKQKDFLNGNIKKKKLSKTDASKINAASESNMSYEQVGGDIPNDTGNTMISGNKTQCMVVKGITSTLIDSGLLSGHAQDPAYIKGSMSRWGRTDYIAEGLTLGTMLGKRLKTRDEERNIRNTRMETGRIDRRLVAELGFGNDRVFAQTIHQTVTPSLVHISIDASGSMGGNKWEAAMKTSVAIAKAASMVSSLDCIISVRGSYGSWSNQSPLMWVVYDSRVDKFNVIRDKMYAVQAAGSTPEGLCYQAVMKDIIKSANGKEAFFINICDGEPGYSDQNMSYGGEYALQHTANQVKKMAQAGIKTLSYFVCEDSSSSYMGRAKDNFRRMYGTNSEFIDTNNLTQLSQSLNKLFVRK
jgi:ribosomal protein L18